MVSAMVLEEGGSSGVKIGSGASSSMAIPLGMLDQCTLSVIFTWRQPAGLVSEFITLSL